ncbi:MAG: hypothetical protein ACR2PR_06800, partial [Pseudohongiellaceae bacterium]
MAAQQNCPFHTPLSLFVMLFHDTKRFTEAFVRAHMWEHPITALYKNSIGRVHYHPNEGGQWCGNDSRRFGYYIVVVNDDAPDIAHIGLPYAMFITKTAAIRALEMAERRGD